MPDEVKAAFSPEQTEELTSLMGKTVNNMLTARMGTFEKKLKDSLGGSVGEALKAQLPELIKELRPAVDPEDKDGKGKGGKRAEDVVEMATMRKQIEDLRKANEVSNAKVTASEAKRREMDRQKQVLEALAAGGIVDPFKQELALSYLDRKGRVTWSGDEDDASLLWNDGANPVEFSEGFGSWLKTDEVKHFLPATGAKGAGSRPIAGAPANGGKPTKEQQWEIVGEAFKNARDQF